MVKVFAQNVKDAGSRPAWCYLTFSLLMMASKRINLFLSLCLLLVFHRKDLCEARVNLKVCSYLADGPPPQLSIDLWKTTTLHKFHDRLTQPPSSNQA